MATDFFQMDHHNFVVQPQQADTCFERLIPTICQEIRRLPLPSDIIERAVHTYERMKVTTHRSNRRKRLKLYCIISAMFEILEDSPDMPIYDPYEVAKMLELSPKDVSRSFAEFTAYRTNYQPPMVLVTAINLLPRYIDRLENIVANIGRLKKEVTDFARRLYNKDAELHEEPPRKVAVGILLYYLRTVCGLEKRTAEFRSIFGISEVTINNIFKRISQIDNE